MAKTSMIQKWLKEPKFKVRGYNRCNRCARPRAYIRYAGICRICFRGIGVERRTAGRSQSQPVVQARPDLT